MENEATRQLVAALLPLVPILPLAASAVNGLAGKKLSTRVVSLLGCGSVFVSFLITAFAYFQVGHSLEQPIRSTLYTWIASDNFRVAAEFLLDPLSLVMMLVVTGVGFLIHVYSIGYMHGDKGYARYFAYLNLFIFSMLCLVMGSSLVVLFLGWEGVGLCSYLLIGFWYEDPEKASAGKKAFIVNRIGDCGFLIAVLWLFKLLNTVDFLGMRELITASPARVQGAATAICLCLFLGACGKSAQIPLFVWLPDAMAGPTPVSALIHAATMVTAGVYMIARMSFLYVLSPVALTVVACVGVATALFSATIGMAQYDIKKVLAYSTVSQLGYMFLGVGVGAFSAGIFHLTTHAFFKALLFLGSGSVIHALSGEQDIRKMGGLAKAIPRTYLTFALGTIAIAGIPPFSGFFSKDEIIWKAFSTPNDVVPWLPTVLGSVALLAAAMTAAYMTRLLVLTFHGESRLDAHAKEHLHESPNIMTVPLMILAALSVVGGALGLPAWAEKLTGGNLIHHFLEPAVAKLPHVLAGTGVHEASEKAEIALGVGSASMALFAILLTTWLFGKGRATLDALARTFEPVLSVWRNKYWVDEIYDAIIVRPLLAFSEFLWKKPDTIVIDGLVNKVAESALEVGGGVRRWATGNAHVYAFSLLGGAIALVGYLALH